MGNRMVDLPKCFEEEFGVKGDFLVTCPGRVNIIGEHIDYSGYGVLPMAIEQSVRAVVKVSTQEPHDIVLKNVRHQQYKSASFPWGLPEIDRGDPQWYKYFLCGIRGIWEHLSLLQDHKLGLRILVDGSVPPSAGLSSSSALVCCAALCTLRAVTNSSFDNISRNEMAEICAKCERHIGTEGGGMDQAISMLAEAGKATKIDFHPLRTKAVSLPAEAKFVVCHSGVEINKAATSSFNERVVECRIATQVLAKEHNLDWKSCKTLGNLQEQLGVSLSEMVKVVETRLKKDPYTRREVEEILGVQGNDLDTLCLSSNTLHMSEFKLRNRAVHVYGEAWRVDESVEVCGRGEGGGVAELGSLMNASHNSCRDMYECSCPELDKIVQMALAAGAVGSRLTGAGWGGCTVSLVPAHTLTSFLHLMTKHYEDTPSLRPFKDFLFVTSPAPGASVVDL